MTIATITLPWPDKVLSPNARTHRMALARAKKAAREATAWDVVQQVPQGVRQGFADSSGPLAYRVTFYPPDKRHRDDDNMIGAFKAARDGIADALRVDDRRFKPHYLFEDPAAPGRVLVEVRHG